ncbi:hypothetical protein ACFRCI_42090 [Streptomyces sp. NPDC056638]|uniref:hypothetical protein n=1 Tax=Streptomyces sp. NPDC056638 TaxID=3345887 RepID=UPI0036A4687B
MDRDDEPVFIRSKWGTSRYVYNPRNPIGLALIVISLLFAVVMLILMQERVGPFAPPEPTPWSTVPAYEPWPASTYAPDTYPTPSAEEPSTDDPSGP